MSGQSGFFLSSLQIKPVSKIPRNQLTIPSNNQANVINKLTRNPVENSEEKWRFRVWQGRFLGTVCFLLQMEEILLLLVSDSAPISIVYLSYISNNNVLGKEKIDC